MPPPCWDPFDRRSGAEESCGSCSWTVFVHPQFCCRIFCSVLLQCRVRLQSVSSSGFVRATVNVSTNDAASHFVYAAFRLAQASVAIDQAGFGDASKERSALRRRESEPSHKKFTQTLRHISLRAREVGGCAPSLAIERQRWRHAVARLLRNLGEPRRERLHQQLSQLAARAVSARGPRSVRERLAQGRPVTRFRV